MFDLFLMLSVIIAVFLIFVILVQSPKGGLSENFSSSNKIFGAKATTDIIEKITWGLGIALFVCVFAANIFNQSIDDEEAERESEINIESIEE